MANTKVMKAIVENYNKSRSEAISKGRLGEKYSDGEENTEEWNTLVRAESAFTDADSHIENFENIAEIIQYGWESNAGYEIESLIDYAADWDKADGTDYESMIKDAVSSLKSALQTFNTAYDKYASAISVIAEKMEDSL